MTRTWVGLGWVGLAVFTVVSSQTMAQGRRQQRRTLRVAAVADGSSSDYRRLHARVRQETLALVDPETNVEFAEEMREADWSEGGVRQALTEALSSNEVDLVVGFGARVGSQIAKMESLRKPVILPLAVPEFQQLPRDGNASGRKNLTYVTGLVNIERDLRRFRDIVWFDRVAIVVDKHVLASLTGVDERVSRAAAELKLRADLVPAESSAAAILESIPRGVGAVYVGPLASLPETELSPLIEGLNARKLPTFSARGVALVSRGVLTAVTPEDDWIRRARRVALYIQRIAAGEPAERLPVDFEAKEDLVINMATARSVGVWPRFALLTEARLIHERRADSGRKATLAGVVREAIARNLDLEAERLAVRSGAQNIPAARSRFLPRLDAGAGFDWIDPDRASPVGPAERTLSWGLNGSQTLYSARGYGDLRAQKRLQKGREKRFAAIRLDIVRDAANAYLNVLRTLTAERVNRENLQRTRRNLALAEVRVAIGVAGREEVFRWEIEIANSRRVVIDAVASRNQAEIELNRVVNRPLEQPFVVKEVALDDASLMIADERIKQHVDNPWAFRVFREFMAKEAHRNSPELRELRDNIRAQQQSLTGQRRALWLPDAVANGGLTQNLHNSGAGSGAAMIAGLPPDVLPGRDDFSWQVGLGLSLPLFDGMARYASIDQTRLEIVRLERLKDAQEQRIEQRIRAAMHRAGASSPAIQLTADAAESAKKNLDLVTDAYRRGAVNVITLIDAQNQALVTALRAANAVYDFLVDFVEVERAVGAFGFVRSKDEQDDFFRRLQQFSVRQRGTGRDARHGETTP